VAARRLRLPRPDAASREGRRFARRS
jgi:hypothetical protein